MLNPLRFLEINHYTVQHPNLPPSLDNLFIAHVTDIHMGRWVRPRHLIPLLELVNQNNPDLTLLTGDYVGYSKRDFEPCAQALRTLQGPVFATFGNHDHWASTQYAQDAFERAMIPTLHNTSTSFLLNPEASPIHIVGVDDAVTRRHDIQQAFQHVTSDPFCIALSHVPELAPSIAQAGAHLILSGHTHGLQFNIPRFSKALASVFRMRYIEGIYTFPEHTSALYVSRGLGSASWPWRFRAAPEIAFLTLKHGPTLDIQHTNQRHTRITPIPRRSLTS